MMLSARLLSLIFGWIYIFAYFNTNSATAQMLRDELLENYVRRLQGAVGDSFMFMDENSTPHKAQLLENFLEKEGTRRMVLSERLSSLNDIEHVSDGLGITMARRQPPSKKLQALKYSLLEEEYLLSPFVDNITMSQS